jgi:hypothetical protein
MFPANANHLIRKLRLVMPLACVYMSAMDANYLVPGLRGRMEHVMTGIVRQHKEDSIELLIRQDVRIQHGV